MPFVVAVVAQYFDAASSVAVALAHLGRMNPGAIAHIAVGRHIVAVEHRGRERRVVVRLGARSLLVRPLGVGIPVVGRACLLEDRLEVRLLEVWL
jgi:hypothetical protein